jgi:ketosteroid isomerase-like protein
MPTQDWWNALFAAIDGRDTPAFLGFLTDDAEFRFGSHPSAHGRDAIGEAVAGFFGMIGGCSHRQVRTWQDGAHVACQGEVTYTRLDGSRVTLPFVNVFEMRGDKVARYLIYNDLAPLFAPAA